MIWSIRKYESDFFFLLLFKYIFFFHFVFDVQFKKMNFSFVLKALLYSLNYKTKTKIYPIYIFFIYQRNQRNHNNLFLFNLLVADSCDKTHSTATTTKMCECGWLSICPTWCKISITIMNFDGAQMFETKNGTTTIEAILQIEIERR